MGAIVPPQAGLRRPSGSRRRARGSSRAPPGSRMDGVERGTRRVRLALRSVALLAALAGVAGVSTAAGAGVPALRVGQVTLHPCAPTSSSYCGSIRVPLDYSSAASPSISIGFRWLPATGHPVGTVLAVEGGPGYASTGSAGI